MRKNNIIANLNTHFSDHQIFIDEPMKNHTSFKTGGCTDILIEPSDENQLKYALSLCKNNSIPFYVFGKCTNLLVSDNGIQGVVIKIADNFSGLSIIDNKIIAKAGTTLKKMVNYCHINGYHGLETLAGIPGTVGGGVYMNAGAYGGEIKDSLISIEAIDENADIIEIPTCDLHLSYRSSILHEKNWVVTKAIFELHNNDLKNAKSVLEDLNIRRKSKQPLNYPSAGSTFKRPVGYYAAKLIEDCGLKGYCIGDACVSEKHSGFIINKGNATSKDIYHLIQYVQEKVYLKDGVKLEPEVRMVGEF